MSRQAAKLPSSTALSAAKPLPLGSIAFVTDFALQERMEGIESKHRNRPAEESLAVWQEMVAGTPTGLANCMRFKISMSNLNKAMRDPVAYRCNLIPHIRTGSKYKVCVCVCVAQVTLTFRTRTASTRCVLPVFC